MGTWSRGRQSVCVCVYVCVCVCARAMCINSSPARPLAGSICPETSTFSRMPGG